MATGTAVIIAARDTLDKLQTVAGNLLRIDPTYVEYRNQVFSAKDNADNSITLSKLLSKESEVNYFLPVSENIQLFAII